MVAISALTPFGWRIERSPAAESSMMEVLSAVSHLFVAQSEISEPLPCGKIQAKSE